MMEGEEVFSQKQQLRTDLNAVVQHGSYVFTQKGQFQREC